MRENSPKIELLAPAKDKSQGKTAILAGADAVYIGPEKFGARAKVGNSLNDIAELIQFAAPFHVNVYATINTLLFNNEIDEAVSLIHHLADIGIDGIIIQDMGLVECELPGVPLIASTQCFINTPEKARFYESLGFKRLILPRELNLVQISEIKKAAPNIELEYFIHGALCVSYSGQCYMSYALGGRSGNRGVCAQPCRKKYSLFDSNKNLLVKDKHLLSLKDLNQSEHLNELLDAGITSFKIEGRLKDDTYVKNILSYYRKKLDNILFHKGLKRTSSGQSIINFIPNPEKTFNRGYTDYFITGKQDKIGSIDTPKMKGESIGSIKSITSTSFDIETEIQLSSGDGISYFAKADLNGTKVNQVSGKTIFPDSMANIIPGMEIFRNYDHDFLKKVSRHQIERKIEISILVTEDNDGYEFSITDEDNIRAEIHIPKTATAENIEKAKIVLTENLKKCGNTQFACNQVILQIKSIPFLKRSEINKIRRNLIAKLLELRIVKKPKYQPKHATSNQKYPTCKLGFQGNIINKKAHQFYKRQGVESIEPGAETGIDLTGKSVMTTKYCLRKELGQCLKKTNSTGNPDWHLADDSGNTFTLKFHCNLCEMDVILD